VVVPYAMICAIYGMRSTTLALQVVSGDFCQKTFLLLPPFNIIFTDGVHWDCLNVSMMPSWKRVGWQVSAPLSQLLLLLIERRVKTTEAGGKFGFDAAKKIKGRKRHIVTDTMGNLLEAVVHEADIQDRDGAPQLLTLLHSKYPSIVKVYA